MNYEHIKYPSKPKIQCFAVMINNRMAHFHNDMEFIYVVEGSVCVECKTETYVLNTRDILILESNVVHSLYRTDENNLLLAMQFDPSVMIELSPQFHRLHWLKHLYTANDGAQY